MDGAKAPERTERPPTPISCLLHRQPGGGVRNHSVSLLSPCLRLLCITNGV